MGASVPDESKVPRTDRGRRTLRKLLDAAAGEFGEHGFHEASISSITRRAGVALGSFYTYFDSKDAIFRALVSDMSEAVKQAAREGVEGQTDAFAIERAALESFLLFATDHKEIYRIIDESEFVDPVSYRAHYETTAQRIGMRLEAGRDQGVVRADLSEVETWALMGMNVFLGLRFAIWQRDGDPSAKEVASIANALLQRGIGC